MADNARKYSLNAGEIKSCGISACTISNQYNLLNSFTISGNYYSQITTNELSTLTKPDYLKRVCAFLTYNSIEEGEIRSNLIENASIYDPTYDVTCKLNSDFLVYRFFDGVRVVDTGKAIGEIQYRAYPIENDPSGYTWQTSATFFNINLNKMYVFEVRDFSEGEEICRVQKTVSLSLLVQSTTFLPEEKLVYINKITCDSSSSLYYNNGTIKVDSSLVDNEIVSVNYTLFADAYADAQSCAQLFCKANNTNTYVNYHRNTDVEGSSSGSFTLHAGDSMCYNLSTIIPSPGSCGCSCLEITSVGGGGTTSPTIDQSRSLVTRDASYPRENVSVSLNETIISSTECYEKKSGDILFTPAIPENNSMTLELTGLAERSATFIDNKATIVVKCKPNGGSTFDDIITHSHNNSQPLSDYVVVRYGDNICYELEVEATDDQISTSCFAITDTDSSNGITPSIGSPNGVCTEKDIPPIPVVVSMCQEDTEYNTNYVCGHGYINIDPLLSGNQYTEVYLNGTVCVSNTGSPTFNDKAVAVVLCKSETMSDYVDKFYLIQQANGRQTENSKITIQPNDSICYYVLANSPNTDLALSCLKLTDAIGYNGVSGSTNSSKCEHFVNII